MSPSRKVNVAVAQCCTVGYDTAATLQKMERLVKQAKKEGNASFILFPEAFVGGYPKGRTFGSPIGFRLPEGRQAYLDYFNASIPIPGPEISEIERISKENEIVIASGVIERDGGTLYCSAVWVDPELGLVDSRRKLMPTAGEKLIWGQGSHKDIKVIPLTLPTSSSSTTTIKTSSTICWENYMPLFRYSLYQLGTEIYCAPTVDGRESWGSTMRHVAMEGRCFVLSSNQFSTVADHPEDHSFDTPDKKALPVDEVIAGGSMIVNPLGEVLAGPLRGEEGVLTAEIDLDDIIRGKLDLDVTGHYSRGDIFELSVRGQ